MTDDYAIYFKSGVLTLHKAGEATILHHPIILTRGEIVLMDGTIQFGDGSKKCLSDGDYYLKGGFQTKPI